MAENDLHSCKPTTTHPRERGFPLQKKTTKSSTGAFARWWEHSHSSEPTAHVDDAMNARPTPSRGPHEHQSGGATRTESRFPFLMEEPTTTSATSAASLHTPSVCSTGTAAARTVLIRSSTSAMRCETQSRTVKATLLRGQHDMGPAPEAHTALSSLSGL